MRVCDPPEQGGVRGERREVGLGADPHTLGLMQPGGSRRSRDRAAARADRRRRAVRELYRRPDAVMARERHPRGVPLGLSVATEGPAIGVPHEAIKRLALRAKIRPSVAAFKPPSRMPVSYADSVMFKSLICSLIIAACAALGAGCGGATSASSPSTTTITSSAPATTPATAAQGKVTSTNPNNEATTPAKTTPVPVNPGAGRGTPTTPRTPHLKLMRPPKQFPLRGKPAKSLPELLKGACAHANSPRVPAQTKAGLKKICEKVR
jgi:hypothetical protein